MKVLVTGASGFIGNKTALHFLDRDYEVLGWNRSASNEAFPVRRVDMFDETAMIEALKLYRPDIIIHCAGSADVGKSVQNPIADYEGNVTITHNLLFAIHKLGLERIRFIFLSSASVYGNPKSLPIAENAPLNPLSPYAVHKTMCEELCKYFVDNYGIDVKVARIFSAYGEGLRKQIFWDMYRKFMKSGQLDMFGSGNESRDYIHVDDVVQALYLLATTESKDLIFNVANGEEISIREVTEIFADCVKCPIDKISFNGVIREGDPLNWCADITKVRKLGYKKTKTIKKGIADYIEWIEEI